MFKRFLIIASVILLQACGSKEEVGQAGINYPADLPHTRSRAFIHTIDNHDYLFVLDGDFEKSSEVVTTTHAGSCWCFIPDDETDDY